MLRDFYGFLFRVYSLSQYTPARGFPFHWKGVVAVGMRAVQTVAWADRAWRCRKRQNWSSPRSGSLIGSFVEVPYWHCGWWYPMELYIHDGWGRIIYSVQYCSFQYDGRHKKIIWTYEWWSYDSAFVDLAISSYYQSYSFLQCVASIDIENSIRCRSWWPLTTFRNQFMWF